MNRNKEKIGEETKNMNRYERRQGEATDRNIRGQEEAPQQRDPPGLEQQGGRSGERTSARNPDWNIWGRKNRQAP